MESTQHEASTRIHACLLGGAIGDALGAPIEFDSLATIRARFGAAGIRDFAEAYGRLGAITDDTQMTLFTAEGLLRGYVRSVQKGICHPPAVIQHAYLRWLFTQGSRPEAPIAKGSRWPDGWLVRDKRLFCQRAPGITCLSALRATTSLGEPAQNDSKGCGTVMRVAPIGLVMQSNQAYDVAAESSALTHGHPTGIIAAGAFAFLVAHLMRGWPLPKAVAITRAFVCEKPESSETVRAIDAAVALAESGDAASPENVESLGRGWVAEEALSIAIYCALVARSFEDGVLLAVNHSGDADSTGSMAGQLLGIMYGLDAIPSRWRTGVELRDVLETIATDLVALRARNFDTRANWDRYPGW